MQLEQAKIIAARQFNTVTDFLGNRKPLAAVVEHWPGTWLVEYVPVTDTREVCILRCYFDTPHGAYAMETYTLGIF